VGAEGTADVVRQHDEFPGLRLAEAALARLDELADDGTIGQSIRQQLQRGLDLEAARLSDDQH
jgi:hypothetical protein